MKTNQLVLLMFLIAIVHNVAADEIQQSSGLLKNAPEACACTMSQTKQLVMTNCSCGQKQCVVSMPSYGSPQTKMQCFDAPKTEASDAKAKKST
ncbi:hypothetical protein [Pseudomonas fluorescens]|uniref:hypothetical protein n=1 Tax=Pseudomonas fluorescens TaxID=294 RepID=UPI000CD13574|nr:hypothetical protein [Pseudomonas fluorescens]PNY78781.1 hypothetical protein C1751_01765 [Pseudomonas fluorescens]